MFREKRALIVLMASFVVVVFALSGCGGNGAETEKQTEAETTEETQQDAPTGGTVGTGGGIEVGMVPPSFTLPDLEGSDVSLSDFEGKVVVLDLWATWCAPCRKEIPFLVELHQAFEDRGLVVLGVGLDQGGARALKPFAEEYGITYPVLVGNRDVQAAYRVTSIPTTFLIGRDGRIAARHVGYDPSMAGSFREEVMGLLDGEMEV